MRIKALLDLSQGDTLATKEYASAGNLADRLRGVSAEQVTLTMTFAGRSDVADIVAALPVIAETMSANEPPPGPPDTKMTAEQGIKHDVPRMLPYTPDDAIYARATMEKEVERLKAEFKQATGRDATLLVFSVVAVREIMKWADVPKENLPGGGWHTAGAVVLFGLKVLISIHVQHRPGFIVVG